MRRKKKIKLNSGRRNNKHVVWFMTDNLPFLLPDENKSIKTRDTYYVMTLTNCAINQIYQMIFRVLFKVFFRFVMIHFQREQYYRPTGKPALQARRSVGWSEFFLVVHKLCYNFHLLPSIYNGLFFVVNFPRHLPNPRSSYTLSRLSRKRKYELMPLAP